MSEPSFEGLELTRLREKDRFGEFMIVAWGFVELFVDLFLFDSYGIADTDAKANLLRGIQFQRKLKYLKQSGYLSSPECDSIQALESCRNQLFHYHDGKFAYMLADPEKKKHAYEDGDRAVDTCLSVLLRKHPEAADQFKTR